uniref:Uncharacterized protein n=1 Tax=Salix viminalis TaxID=40686 RepID=A0A6N2L4E6_SALVM
MEVAKSEISKEADDGFELLRVKEPIKMMYLAALSTVISVKFVARLMLVRQKWRMLNGELVTDFQ